MGFDPNSIRRPRLTPDKLPGDASRADKVAALANILHERGVTASMADARRLAEGMVDVERKVLQDAPKRESLDEVRQRAQSTPLFGAAGVKPPEPQSPPAGQPGFDAFVQRVAAEHPPRGMPQRSERPPAVERPHDLPRPNPRRSVFFDEAPSLGQTRGFASQAPQKQRFDPFLAQQMERPAVREPAREMRAETTVEASDDGIAVRTVAASPGVEVVAERAVVAASLPEPAAPRPDPAPRQEARPGDPSQPQKVDLFQMFKVNK